MSVVDVKNLAFFYCILLTRCFSSTDVMQDCAEESDGTCGGLANNWDHLYNTVTDCCHNQLSWIASSVCEARSTVTTAIGTSKWYVDWTKEKVRIQSICC